MAEIVFVVIGVTAGAGFLLGSILTTYCCCKRYYRHRAETANRLSKRQQEEDYLHSVIINQHIARHLRPQSSISFISHNYHHDMTLIAPPRRLAMLEQQQKEDSSNLVIENPLVSLSNLRAVTPQSTPLSAYVYENPSLELGELPTINSIPI